MQKWEYTISSRGLGSPNETYLNVMGADGWELCGINEYSIVFKRPKPKSISIGQIKAELKYISKKSDDEIKSYLLEIGFSQEAIDRSYSND